LCQCDLFESAEFVENLDAEQQHDIVHAYQERCAAIVKQFGGSIVQMAEPSMLACFGYPIAYEDSAARAVRTGLTLRKEIAQWQAQLQHDQRIAFTISVNIHTGMAVVGDVPGGSGPEAFSVVGEARNVIGHQGAVARPDTLVISQNTNRLVQGYFVCESVGTSAIKGVARPLEFFRVLRENEAQSRVDVAAPAGLTPLVGRDREVGLLQDRWEQAVEGMGQIVLIIGEAGLGKSRLVHVIKEYVGGQAADLRKRGQTPSATGSDSFLGGDSRSIVEWRCTPHHQNSSFFPVIDYFERRLGFQREGDPALKFETLRSHLHALELDGADTVPYFASLLSVPLAEPYTPSTLSPARQKEKTLEALLQWMRAHARKQPFLFVIEDLHWLDPSTLELVAAHVECGLTDSILTVLTFRPEFETPWKSKAHQTVMALNRLTKKQIGQMMRQKTGVQTLPAALIEQIAAKTDGVPLFVEEYTQMVVESGKLTEDGSQATISGSFLTQQIPATLQDLLMARLDRIASDREVVQVAATLGREFSYELLQAVMPMEGAALQAELDKLVVAELLYQKGKPPESSYQFKHALIQDAAYSSLLKAKKQQVHRQVAHALEKQFAATIAHQPELLAHHFTEAGLTSKAIEYWLKAGRRSQERSANQEAIGHFTRGLELIATLAEGSPRDRLELDLQIPLGAALVSTRGYAAPEVGPVFDRAHALSQKLGDASRRFQVLYGLWGWHLVRDELEVSKQLSDETMELAGTLGDPGISMEAHHLPANTLFYLGDFQAALQACEQGFALYDRERCMHYARIVGQNSGVTLQSYWALALWSLGYPDRALQRSRSAIALARDLNHPFSLCYALHFAAWLHQFARLGKEAQEFAEAEHQLAVEQGFAFWQAGGLLFGGAALLLHGKPDAAKERIAQGLDIFRATGAQLSLSYYLSFKADVQRQSGKLDDALRTLDDALAIVARTHNRYYEAELLRLKGELLLQRSDHQDAAEDCFQKSLAVARAQEARSWELRTTLSLARLRQRQGRSQESKDMLVPINATFTEGFAMPDLADAKALLESS
jgi:class 3 adenylate cyclase/predicted ATPase